MATENEERVFDTQQLAKFLNVSERTIYNWRSAGKGPSYSKFGDGRGAPVFYRWSHVEKWLDSHLLDTGPEKSHE